MASQMWLGHSWIQHDTQIVKDPRHPLINNIPFPLLSHKMCSPVILSWIQFNHPFILTTPFISFHSRQGEVAQPCPTLCDPMDYNLLGFSVHGILQARILEWIAISFSTGSSRPMDQTQVSRIGGRRFNLWATREAQFHSKSPWVPDVTSKGQLSLHFIKTVNSVWHTSLRFEKLGFRDTFLFFPSLPPFLSFPSLSIPHSLLVSPHFHLSSFSPLFLSSLVLLPLELLPVFLVASFYLPYF